jgi:TRAP-type mannitol/chloroaromatic compound transport system substrate-binding protein
MRIGTGLGGKVYVKAGGTAVLTPGAEVLAALERGVIDAAEWIGPHGQWSFP